MAVNNPEAILDANAGAGDGSGMPVQRAGQSRTRLYARRFLRHKGAVIGLGIFVALVLFAVVGELISPYRYDDVDFLALSLPPDATHWFGTNANGNDLFAQTAHGLQRSLIIGLAVSLGTTVISALAGAGAAYFGGAVETVVLRLIEFLLVVPTFLLLAIVAKSTGGNWGMLIVVLIAFGWMFSARVVLSLAQSVREREYVQAARFMGVGSFAIIWRHMVPNMASLLIIGFTMGVVATVQSETGLSFLGFGVQVPDVSLGTLLAAGTGTLQTAPWLFFIPALVLTLLTVSMALIADGLRDAFDPQSHSGGKA